MSNTETTAVSMKGTTVADNPPLSTGANAPPVRTVEKVYLTIEEASELSGLSTDYLGAKLQAGELKSVKDGVDKIRRSDLERL